MSGPVTDPGHLLPADEWSRVVAEAEAIARGEHPKLARAGVLPTLSRSSFPSITGFVQAKYDGGARPGAPTFGVWHDAETPLTDGYALAIANYFTRCTNQTSAHFMLGPEAGYQLLDTARVGWHCGNGNPRSIGVENCGYVAFTPAQWLTADGQAQMQRGATLIREIHAAHGIEPRWMTDPAEILACHHGQKVGGWITHDQASKIIGGSTHTDPMPTYPLQQLMALANQEDDMPLTDADVEKIWNYSIAKRGGYGPGPAWVWLADARIGVAGVGSDVTKLLTAVTALAASKGVDPAVITQTVSDAVTAALTDLTITLSTSPK